MTFEEWANNPMGPKSKVITHRELFRQLYKQKLDNLLAREMGNISYQLFLNKSEDKYAIHIKIPSEVVPKFYYDVVIEFTTKNQFQKTLPSLAGYDIRVFSNDPAFVYTWVYAYNKKKLFIDELSSKMSKLSLKDKPKETNPNLIIGYCKSIYFAYLIMKSRGLFLKTHYVSNGLKLSYPQISKHIVDASTVIEERKEKGEEIQKQKAKEKRLKEKLDNRASSSNSNLYSSQSKLSKKSNSSNTVATVKKVKNTTKIPKKK